ncbi:hypothetical protein [Viridibacillus arvi]|uniref:hypothetical protein n=1 Tax=Viridibacillus arvi TaxID=263475 RepID=UPI0034CDA161
MALTPIKVTKTELAFGRIDGLLPDMEKIPKEFFNENNKCHHIISKWFFYGLSLKTDVEPKDGINIADAINHISAILASYQPKHEHKIAGCAYLLNEFFSEFNLVTAKND